jgi:hypothetical protein
MTAAPMACCSIGSRPSRCGKVQDGIQQPATAFMTNEQVLFDTLDVCLGHTSEDELFECLGRNVGAGIRCHKRIKQRYPNSPQHVVRAATVAASIKCEWPLYLWNSST